MGKKSNAKPKDESQTPKLGVEKINKSNVARLWPVLCLDLDGTVRKSKSGAEFIKDENDIEIIKGVVERIVEYQENGYLVAFISNQGGVAHGYKTEDTVQKEITKTIALLYEKANELKITMNPGLAYYCPFDETGKVEPYCHKSLMRKPNIGMLVLLEHEINRKSNAIIDWKNSLFVGDRKEDAECAANAGIEFIHINKFLENE